MIRPPCNSRRWSLRRTLLGVALVLHVVWMSLGVAPAASAATAASAASAATQAAPCHDGMMMAGMDMSGMSMDAMPVAGDIAVAHDTSGSLPTTPPAPAHLPCCAQHCACASGLCTVASPLLYGTRMWVQYRLSIASFPVAASRTPTPELRPPILH